MYRLFIANKNYSSWSLRPWAAMKGLGIPFEEVQYFLNGSSSNHAAFRTFSPTGKVPCLHDGSTQVWDSLAILEYLAEHHAGVWPADPVARAWARCASAEMHSSFQTLRNDCSMSVGVRVTLRTVSTALQQDLHRLDELLNEGLSRFRGPWLAGANFGGVDAFFAPVAFRVQTYGLTLSSPVMTYFQRILTHPAMQAWQQGALQETVRDAWHEQEIMGSGEVLADYRQPEHTPAA